MLKGSQRANVSIFRLDNGLKWEIEGSEGMNFQNGTWHY